MGQKNRHQNDGLKRGHINNFIKYKYSELSKSNDCPTG